MPENADKTKELARIAKIFKVLFLLTIVYVVLSVGVNWFYFLFQNPTGKNISFAAGIYSTLTYLGFGFVIAVLFYGFSKVIELLININARIK